MLQSPNEELATECDVDADIAVHGVLAQKIDSKLFACLGESKLAVQCQDVSKYSSSLVILHKTEQEICHFWAWLFENTILG
jgi:hypothetical protein